jgi:glutaredoxin-like protein NrdH
MSVIIWTKIPCVQCTAVKREFKKAGVEFEEKSLPDNLEALEAFKAKGLASAPIVESGELETFAGFNPDAVKEYIAVYGTKA